MNISSIIETINTISVPDANYVVFLEENGRCYFGKDKEDNIVFMLPSALTKVSAFNQVTKSLRFSFNKKCTFVNNSVSETKVMHVLTCSEKQRDKLCAFIRLTRAFSTSDPEKDQYYLARLFASISALFDKQRQVSEMELQGLFAELYAILHFRDLGCDIARHWQSHDKMKFDFSISNKKRIEIKSTIKANRTHHFNHDQLLSSLYDIKIVSIMLQKNDYGLSLGEVVEIIREEYADDFALLLRIESTIAHVDQESLNENKFDRTYLENNIRYFDASIIPHFNEKSPEGVFNAEYDCSLDTVQNMPKDEIKNWIKENVYV